MRDERKLEVLAKLVGKMRISILLVDTFTLMSVLDYPRGGRRERFGKQCVKARTSRGSNKGPTAVIAEHRDEYAAQRRAVFEAAFLVAVAII